MKKASKVPSTDSWPAAAVRPLDCGRRSPDDQLGRRPDSAGRVDRACAAAGVSGVVARPRREVGEGLLSSTTTASLGRARRARWAAPLPQPSAPAPAHRSAPMLTAPTPPSRTAGRPGDRARSRQRPWHSAVRSRPIYTTAPQSSGQPPRLAGSVLGALKGAVLPRRRGSPVRAGSTCPRPARDRPPFP